MPKQHNVERRALLLERTRLPCLLWATCAIVLAIFANRSEANETLVEIGFWVYTSALCACAVRCAGVIPRLAVYGPLVWVGMPFYTALMLIGYELPIPPEWLWTVLDASVSVWMVVAAVILQPRSR